MLHVTGQQQICSCYWAEQLSTFCTMYERQNPPKHLHGRQSIQGLADCLTIVHAVSTMSDALLNSGSNWLPFFCGWMAGSGLGTAEHWHRSVCCSQGGKYLSSPSYCHTISAYCKCSPLLRYLYSALRTYLLAHTLPHSVTDLPTHSLTCL